ncbi:MAG: bifunctional phosphopantothenoylcysteine decarboxylase/phosphopantothenate--cysteine ligase CoaBC [Bacteroidota bacterium]
MSLKGKRIILALSGSIAAYKAVYLLRLLKKAEAVVKVVTTPSVDHFVGELTLSSLSGHKVFSGLWNENWSEHVSLGTWADLMIVAPATANTLAKMSLGLCDNALTAVYLAARCPVMVAPAMDADMMIHPRTQANLERLREDGVEVLPTGTGFLASGLEGPGRLLEPEDIFQRIEARFANASLLAGKRVLVSAGPTREAIDPVRFISNHSSGKMGYALARTAQAFGADVTLVSGPVSLSPPEGVNLIQIQSAAEMLAAIKERSAKQDVIVMAAAVADYTPAEVADEKMKKKEGDMAIPLRRTVDILRNLGEKKQAGQVLVGFAMETQNELENARKKLASKNLDFIVLNSLREAGAGFGHDTNRVSLIHREKEVQELPLMSKEDVAKHIWQEVGDILGLH